MRATGSKNWSVKDDELLRRFHAEGQHDRWIAYVMSRSRTSIMVHRRRLGLPAHTYTPTKGYRHGPDAKVKMADENRRRWADPEYRTRMEEHCRRALAIGRARLFKQPPRGTPEYRRYNKLRVALGPAAAHVAFRQETGHEG